MCVCVKINNFKLLPKCGILYSILLVDFYYCFWGEETNTHSHLNVLVFRRPSVDITHKHYYIPPSQQASPSHTIPPPSLPAHLLCAACARRTSIILGEEPTLWCFSLSLCVLCVGGLSIGPLPSPRTHTICPPHE